MASRGISRVVAVSAAVVFSLSATPVAVQAAPDDGGTGHERRWSQLLDAQPGLMGDHVEAQAQLVAAQRRAADTRADLAWIAGAVSDAEASLALAAEERDRSAALREVAAGRLERAQRSFEGFRVRMDDHAATIYKHGAPGLGPIESLLRSGSPGDFVLRHRMSEAVLLEDDAAVRRAGSAVELARELHGRTVVRAAVSRAAWEFQRDATLRLHELASAQAKQVDSTQRAVGPRSRAVERVASADAGNTGAMTALEELVGNDDPDRRQALERRRVEARAGTAEALETAYPYLGRPPRGRPATMPPVTGYLCPVEGSRFVNDWAFPRPGGRSHEGTDLFAASGTAVVAVAEGTVVGVDRHDAHESGEVGGDLGGRTVTVETPSGERWYFAHLDTVADGIEPGTAVEAGRLLGTLGDSGNARGGAPHLHLGRYWQDVAVNPYPSLALACH